MRAIEKILPFWLNSSVYFKYNYCFNGFFASIRSDYNSMRSNSRLRYLDDLMDKAQYILDEIWRSKELILRKLRFLNFSEILDSQEPGMKSTAAHQYPQNRMVSIIDVLCKSLI